MRAIQLRNGLQILALRIRTRFVVASTTFRLDRAEYLAAAGRHREAQRVRGAVARDIEAERRRVGPAPDPVDAEPLGILFGIRAVASYLGVTKNQARSLAARGLVPCFDVGDVTCARRAVLRRHIEALEAEARSRFEVREMRT